MGPEQAVKIIHKKEIKSNKIKQQKIKGYSEKFLNPYDTAKQGKVDLIIDPKDTRKTLIKCLEMLTNKREKKPPKKHGNIPL